MTGTPWAWLAHGPLRGGPYSGGPPSTFSPQLPALGTQMCTDCVYGLQGVRSWVGLRPCSRIFYNPWRRKLGQHDFFRSAEPREHRSQGLPAAAAESYCLLGDKGSSAHCPRVSFPPGQGSLPGSVKLTLQDPWLPADTALVQPPEEQGSPEWEGDAAGGCFWSGCSEM